MMNCLRARNRGIRLFKISAHSMTAKVALKLYTRTHVEIKESKGCCGMCRWLYIRHERRLHLQKRFHPR